MSQKCLVVPKIGAQGKKEGKSLQMPQWSHLGARGGYQRGTGANGQGCLWPKLGQFEKQQTL